MRKKAVKAKKVDLAERIITLVEEAKRKVVLAVNVALVCTYYEVGRMIVERRSRAAENVPNTARRNSKNCRRS